MKMGGRHRKVLKWGFQSLHHVMALDWMREIVPIEVPVTNKVMEFEISMAIG